MRFKVKLFEAWVFCAVVLAARWPSSLTAAGPEEMAATKPAKVSATIPWSQISAKAGADYKGHGLAVIPTSKGARLRCAFQRLEAEATPEGLWLTSTVTNAVNDRFRIVAAAVGREIRSFERGGPECERVQQSVQALGSRTSPLSKTGSVNIDGQTVRFTRPGMIEEYTASMDGVRQDFIIARQPAGPGELAVWLSVSGAQVEPAASGAQLLLENSGRKIAYSHLRVTDATGKKLSARIEVLPVAKKRASLESEDVSRARGVTPCATTLIAPMLVVLVNDADAVYPLRIDPTFSDANWISMGGILGANNDVRAAVVDGLGNLYIGGRFTLVGDVFANRIAKWNGNSWSALGLGMDGAGDVVVYALGILGTDLYAGGDFTRAGGILASNIARWDGSNWAALSVGVNRAVSALAVSGSDLFAGGAFTNAGGNSAKYIAKWNGNSWTALGLGMSSNVYALAVSGSDLYAGGQFTNAGGIAASRIAKWDGSNWMALGSGMGGISPVVTALAMSGTNLYTGGYFGMAGGIAANNIAKWNGTSWTTLGSGMPPGETFTYVATLAVSGSDLYAGGDFATAGNSAAANIAKWNGSSWTNIGSQMNSGVRALAVFGANVYPGGYFTTAGGTGASRIAKWNGTNWLALGSGIGGFSSPSVSALAVSDSNVYAGGLFMATGGVANVAKWDGTSWTALASGMGGVPFPSVSALAGSGSSLYAGGGFTTAGGSVANYIARWNANSWTALGSGMGGVPSPGVSALAVSGNDIYAGGYFTMAGGSPATNIAKWDGTNWSALGSGLDSSVYALVVLASNLYAGGQFTMAGGSAANYIAKWTGNNWTALGSGMNGIVRALAVSGSNVYAGGSFTTAGGIAVNCISKWDGTSWTALGSGIGGIDFPYVSALAVLGSDVYAGGQFTTGGGSVVNHLAKWNGSTWTALGSGVSYGTKFPVVSELVIFDNDLYVGGEFTTAGGKVSAYIARAYLPTLPTLSVFRSGTDLMVCWPSADTTSFVLEQAGTLAAPPSWVTNSASVIDDGTKKSVILPATNNSQFFRLRRP